MSASEARLIFGAFIAASFPRGDEADAIFPFGVDHYEAFVVPQADENSSLFAVDFAVI
jgi:hypothetical protein